MGCVGSDTHQECHEEHFPPYLWRQGQPLAPHTRPAAANSSSPSVSSLSSSGSREERQDDTLPSSLSGMARHFQAQRAAQADRRGHLPTKPSRCSMQHVKLDTDDIGCTSDTCIVASLGFRADMVRCGVAWQIGIRSWSGVVRYSMLESCHGMLWQSHMVNSFAKHVLTPEISVC